MKHRGKGFLAVVVSETEPPHNLFNPDGAIRVTQDPGLGLYAPNGSIRIGQEESSSAYTSQGALNAVVEDQTLLPNSEAPSIPDPVVDVIGSGYSGSTYVVTNGGTGNWQSNGADISGQTTSSLLMTLELEGTNIRWVRSDSKVSNAIQMRRPQDVSNLVALFDIRQGVTQSGGSVSGWTSQVGGVSGVQANSAQQPIYSATAFDGAPGMTFNGSRLEGVALNTGPLLRTVISTVSFTSTTGGAFFDGLTNNNYLLRRIASRVMQIVRRGVSVLGASTTIVPDNTATVFTARHGNNLWSMRANGVSIGSGSGSTTGFTSGSTQQIGSSSGGLVGVMSSLAIYDAALNDDELSMVEGWIAHTLGKASLLDSSHPYKDPSSMRINT